MRKAISAILTIALTGTAMPAVGDAPSTRGDAVSRTTQSGTPSGQGFCRRPAPLPDLGAEREVNQQARPEPAEPYYAAREEGGDAEIVTTARRVDAPAKGGKRAAMVPPPPPPAPPPPPPPMEPVMAPPPAYVAAPEPMATAAAEARAEGGAVRDGRIAPGVMPPRPRPQPQPQGGTLTAGEHDDLLNPELYADYVRRSDLGQRVPALPALDTARLVTVEVRDTRGRPAPFVPVELRCADGNSLTFTTQADGTVVFFPGMDRLSDSVQVRAGQGQWRTLDVPRTAGTGRVGITLGEQARQVTRLDLALVVDVTGSMSDELQFLQAELDSIVASLNRRHPELDIRVGMTFYRDRGDEFVTRTFGFTGDVPAARGNLSRQFATGGGDYEEAMQDALVRAAQLDWRPDAVKTLLLVADAPPHAEDVARTWLAAEHLRAQRVQIVPVGASGVGDLAEYVMRAMAAATQSRYAFLTDDSGVGNPHAPPAIDCYLVTRLDKLLTRIIDSQVSGRRVEPDKADVIRSVGQYDAGKCVLPRDFGQRND